MAYLCPHPCDGKTEYGYCRYTWCINPLHSNLGTAYQGQGVQKAIITNADRIRAMSDEDLAGFIDDFWSAAWCPDDPPVDANTKECLMHDGNCQLCILDWLRQEANDD